MGNFFSQSEDAVTNFNDFETLLDQLGEKNSTSCRVDRTLLQNLINRYLNEKVAIQQNCFQKIREFESKIKQQEGTNLQIQQLMNEKSQANQLLANAKTQFQEMMNDKNTLLKEITTVSNEKDFYRRESDERQQKLNQAEKKLESIKLQHEVDKQKIQDFLKQKQEFCDNLTREKNQLHEQNEYLNQSLQNSNRAKETLSNECEKLSETVGELKKTIADKSQELIGVMADMDSSIFSSSDSDDGKIRPQIVHKQFDTLMDIIHELQLDIKSNCDSSTEDYSKRMSNVYKKILESLFDPGLWKILKKPMESKRLLKQSMCLVLTGKQENEKGMNKELLKNFLLPPIESHLKKIIEKGTGKDLSNEFACKLIKKSAENALFLAAQLVVSKPTMGIIAPKKGSDFNPDKHEDATCETKMVVTSIKRPGLICVRDNRVFAKASVETETKNA